MKRLFWIMAISLLSMNIMFAQERISEEERQVTTLFGDTEFKSSGYGGPTFKLTSINNELGVMLGGRGAWTINKVFSIGLAGYGAVSQHNVLFKNYEGTDIDGFINFGYGGLYLEYIHQPYDFMHFSGNILIGGAGAYYSEERFANNDRETKKDAWNAMLAIEPTLAVEFNILRFFRISVEGSYRFLSNVAESDVYKANQSLKDLKLSGFSGGITFQFGSF